MVWSGSRPACLPLPFICLPVLFICLPSSVLVVGFAAGLSPTSFHLSPTSFHLSPRLVACGRVRGWLVSHFLSFVSSSFLLSPSSCHLSPQAGCLWSGSRLACLPLPFICLPLLLFVSQAGCLWSGSRLACLQLPFICLPLLFICLPGWVLVVPAGLSPTSFHLSPTSFHLSPRLGLVSHFLSYVSHFFSFVSQGSRLACLLLPVICLPLLFICLPGWVLVVGFRAGLSPTSGHLCPTSFHLSPRLGACGRVPGWLVSHFLTSFHLSPGSRLACLALAFICLLSFHFFVSQARCLWSGSRLSPTSFPTSFHLSPSSFHLSPRLGACGRVCGWLVSHVVSYVSHFFSFVSHFRSFVSQFFSFVSQAGCLWSGSRLACLPLPFICLRVPGWLVSHFLSFGSYFFSFVSFPFISLSPRLGACGRVPACLRLPFPLLFICLPVLFIVSQAGCLWSGLRLACLPRRFISLPLLFICLPGFPAGLSPTSCHLSPTFSFFVSQAGCLWSGSRLACLLLPVICLPLLFIFCLPGWVLVVGFPAGLSRTFLSFVSYFFSFVSFPFVCLSPRLSACGRVPACLPLPFPLLFICPRVLFIVSQAGCLWSRVCGWLVSHVVSFVIFVSHFFSLSIHLSSRSVAGGVRPFPMSMQHVYSFVSQL